jgi:hypothetical protein
MRFTEHRKTWLALLIRPLQSRFSRQFSVRQLRSILEQVGGTVEAGKKGQITLFFGHQKWSLPHNRIVVNQNGQTVILSKGMVQTDEPSTIIGSDSFAIDIWLNTM